jgi:hypothetical protein
MSLEGNFRIYLTQDNYLIHHLLTSKIISIDRSFLSIQEQAIDILSNSSIGPVYKAFGIIGIIQIGSFDILLYINSSSLVGSIGKTEIFEIKDIDYILLGGNNVKITSEVFSILKGIRCLLQSGFFYSHNYDLTNSLQNQKQIKISNNNQYDIIRDGKKDFFWNYLLYTKFLNYNITSEFMISLIHGNVSITTATISSGVICNYILISRKSVHNAGGKVNKKGVDLDGHVSNFVETEQILINNGKNIFSFVQIRGTAPIFYCQYKKSSNCNSDQKSCHITNYNNDLIFTSFDKHIQSLFYNYKLIFFVNLFSNKREEEQIITDSVEGIIQENIEAYKNLKYSYFDLDAETEHLKYPKEKENEFNLLSEEFNKSINLNTQQQYQDPIESYLEKVESILRIFKFFGMYQNNNIPNERSMIEQIGVVRVMSYDALKRCNIMQMRIAWRILIIQLKLLGLDTRELFGEGYIKWDQIKEEANSNLLFDFNEIIQNKSSNNSPEKENQRKPQHKFISIFKKIWDENGDKLELQYTGINNFKMKINDVINTNENTEHDDKIKQRCLDIFLNRYNIKLNSSKYFYIYIL